MRRTVNYRRPPTRKLSPRVKTFIVETVREVLEDPDFGLALRDDFKRKLVRRERSRRKSVSLDKIVRRYG